MSVSVTVQGGRPSVPGCDFCARGLTHRHMLNEFVEPPENMTGPTWSACDTAWAALVVAIVAAIFIAGLWR